MTAIPRFFVKVFFLAITQSTVIHSIWSLLSTRFCFHPRTDAALISTLELHSKLFTLFSGFCFCFDVTRTIAKTMDLTFKFRTHSRATERQHSHWLALSMEFFTIHHTHSHHPRKILSRFCSALVVHPSYGKRPVITHDSSELSLDRCCVIDSYRNGIRYGRRQPNTDERTDDQTN